MRSQIATISRELGKETNGTDLSGWMGLLWS